MELKRGYWKWTDENGKKHKVRDVGQFFNEILELPLDEEYVEENDPDDV